jgi:hypothetical protein
MKARGAVPGRGAIIWRARVGRGAIPSRGAIINPSPLNINITITTSMSDSNDYKEYC